MKQKIAIMGSTGSIGRTTFNILKKNKKFFNISLLTTNRNLNLIIAQSKIFNVKNLIVTDVKKFELLKKKFKNKRINIYNNFDDLDKIFKKKADYVMSSISGLAGLNPTLKIIKHTKKIAIANKESIICGWSLISKQLKIHKTNIIPVDSEHFSLWSLLNYSKKSKNDSIDEIIITASGGPFLNRPLKTFNKIKSDDAIKHPNWSMGKKISIDSATMMNKVFEVIEAQRLFNIDLKKIKIMIHPKSYVHAIIKFKSGLIKILAHETTMTIPIFNSLIKNNNIELKTKKIDYSLLNNLMLTEVDNKKFPIIKVLSKISNKTSLFETALVAANDQLVDLFLRNKIKFTDISDLLLKILNDKDLKNLKLTKVNKYDEIKKINRFVRLKTLSQSII